MKWLTRVSNMAIDRLPKRISPGTHASLDYTLAAATAAFGVLCLRGNKPAAAAAFIAAMAEVTNIAMADVPGGICKTMSFPLHGRMDMSLSGFLASMPQMMGFSDTRERRFFYATAVATSLLAGMTDYTGTGERAQSHALLSARD